MGGKGGVRGPKAKRVLDFFQVHFDVRPPYRVLCDGTLIHHALQHKLFLKDALPVLLGRSHARMVVSKCIVAELRGMGEKFSAAALMASRATYVECPHINKPLAATDCALELFRVEKHGLLLGTVDNELKAKARVLGCVPIITVSSGSLILERPSNQCQLQVKKNEDKKRTGFSLPPPKLEQGVAVQKFRRRKAKGPNPLSVKKKKATKENKNGQNAQRKQAGTKPSSVDQPETAALKTSPVKGPAVPAEELVAQIALVRKRGKKRKRETRDAEEATNTPVVSTDPTTKEESKDSADAPQPDAKREPTEPTRKRTRRKRKAKGER